MMHTCAALFVAKYNYTALYEDIKNVNSKLDDLKKV